MTQTSTIIGLHAQTSIHAGTGQNTGVIDLPIQREGHNGWPCIFGSAVKGALRCRAEETYEPNHDSVIYVFGPDTSNAADHAGAIAVSDARLLLLPVRSLTSQFKWVTCPAALIRFRQDAERFGTAIPLADKYTVGEEDALVASGKDEKKPPAKSLFLEEYRFQTRLTDLDAVIEALLPLMNNVTKEILEKQLVIISDDNFTHMAQHVTPVNAHIAIDSKTKIVKPGALWYEETLPPETLLYTGLSAVAPRKSRAVESEQPEINNASQVMAAVTRMFKLHGWLQLGGNETVGMGWCAVSFLSDTAIQEGGRL